MKNPPVNPGDTIIAVNVPYIPRYNGQEAVVTRGELDEDGDIYAKFTDGRSLYVREWSLPAPPTDPTVRPGRKVRYKLEGEGILAGDPHVAVAISVDVGEDRNSLIWLQTAGLRYELLVPEFKPGDRINLHDGRYAIWVPTSGAFKWVIYTSDHTYDRVAMQGDVDAIGWERA